MVKEIHYFNVLPISLQSCNLDMGFIIFHKIAVLLGTRQALCDGCSPCFSTLVIFWSGGCLSIYILCNLEWIFLMRMCTLSCLHLWRPLGPSAGLLFWIVLQLTPVSFIWSPQVLVLEEGVNKLISVILSSKQLVVSYAPVVSIVSPMPCVLLL